METLLALICVFVALGSNYIFFVFAVHHKIKNLPGSDIFVSSTEAIIEKYPINTYPARPLVAIAWPGILLMNVAAATTLFIVSFKKQIFSSAFYLLWMVQMLGTVLWTYTFDRELQNWSLLLLVVVFFSYVGAAKVACTYSSVNKKSKSAAFKNLADTSSWWFDGIVMSYFGAVGSWILVTLAATTNYALAYKNSASYSQSHLTGICDVEKCGTISLLLVLVPQCTWTFFDLHIYSSYTKCIKTFYPTLSFFMFGIFLSNYNPGSGLSTNNLFCLFLSVAAFLTWIFRSTLRARFLEILPNSKENSREKTK